MKKRAFFVLCLALCLLAGLFAMIPASAASDPIVISFRSSYDTAKNGELYQHANPPEESGVWEYDLAEKALAVFNAGAHQYWPEYRFMPKFLEKNSLPAEYKYACIVYKTTATNYEFKLRNNGNPSNSWNITTTGKKANAWVVTDPFDLTLFDSAMLNRYNNLIWGTYGFSTDQSNAKFWVKELAFFTSEAQAKEWYKDLNSYITKTDAAAIMTAADAASEKEYLPVDQYPDPFSFSFVSEELLEVNSLLYVHPEDATEGGAYKFTGDSLKLLYSKPSGNWQGQYRVMFQMETINWLPLDYSFVQVTYKTNAKSGELRLVNNGSGTERYVLASDVSVSGGEWVKTDLLMINPTMISRLNTGKPVTLCLHTDATDVDFEVKEMKLYCSPEQAELDAAKDSADSAVEIEPIVYKFGSTGTMLKSGVKFYDHGESKPTEEGVFENVKVGDERALQLLFDNHGWGNYRVMFRPIHQSKADLFKQTDTWYVRVRYKTDAQINSKLTLTNNKVGDTIGLENNFAEKNDDWRITMPIQLPVDFVQRLASNMWLTLGFHFLSDDLNIYITDIGFFPTLESACEYYGDISAEEAKSGATSVSSNSSQMVMSDTATVGIIAGDPASELTGNWVRDDLTGNVKVLYSEYNKHSWGNYRFMPAFTDVTGQMSATQYFRIVYKAKNPENQTAPVALKVISNGKASALTVEDDVQNSDDWVLSPVQQMSPVIHERWLDLENNMHCTVGFFATEPGGEYLVREIVFFRTLEEALNYELGNQSTEITIGGVPVEEFVIVQSENPGRRTAEAVTALKGHIYGITGVALDVITDAEPERKHEIVIGNTTRPASQVYYGPEGKYVTGEISREEYAVFVTDGDLIITGGTEISISEGMSKFMSEFFGYRWVNLPEVLELKNGFSLIARAALEEYTGEWDDPAPVKDPIVFTDDFNDENPLTSPDYWVEAYNTDNWKIKADGENRVYTTTATDFTYTRLHVYERDIDYTVKMRFDDLSDASDAGALVRYNDVGAYIRVGYKAGEWYLRFSEGQEFNVYTLDTAKADVKEGTWYTVRVTAQKNDVKVYIDGKLTLESSYVTHISPGPMGMFAENTSVSFDDVSVTLVSGQGRVMKGVTDVTFWTEEGGLCSGSVLEMLDGNLRYIHANEAQQRISTDGGLTWEIDKFTDITTDCVNIFRLQSGNLIKLMDETVGGKVVHVSYTSEDDGKTWKRGGVVTQHDYMDYGTMIQTIENDKFTQVSNGRIFLSQNYQGSIPKGEPNDHMSVFNQMWYSDDEGKTWTQSKMSSFDCTDITHFGESKVIETADGALLWITPWNNAGYIIASESTDNGVTWGKFYNITELSCSISSFGIMRDEHADNDTTYYMSWVYGEPSKQTMPRSRLSLAMTTDGRNWTFLGDVYRWEGSLQGAAGSVSTALLNHIVDPFLTVTEDYIFVGSGFSARRPYGPGHYHNNQQQKVYRIEKAALEAYDEFPNY